MWSLTKSFCSLALILCMSSAVEAVGRNDLVVMVGYRAVGDPYNVEVGAGILVHQEGERAIVVTARHNLPKRDPASPLFRDETVYVELFSVGGRDFPAQVLAEAADPALDLAVLEVRGVSVSPHLFEAARHVLVPEGAEVVIEHGAFAVGNPNRRPWFQNYTPEPILEKVVQDGREMLRFESSVADVGMSGGALFSEHGALLGMVQKISGGEGGPQALGIGTIARKLHEWKIPFSLEENPEVIGSVSRRILSDLGLASAAGLRKALKDEPADFGLLHLFWLAGLEPLELDTALGGLAEGSQVAFTSQVFGHLGKTEDCLLPRVGSSQLSASQVDLVRTGLGELSRGPLDIEKFQSCSAHLQLWIRGLVRGGLDPDLVVTNRYYRREALLAVAMGSANMPAVLALLSSGASPHPYQDLSGTEYPSTRLLAPLLYVLRDFSGAEKDALRQTFLSAGLVVSESISNSYHNHHLAGEALSGLPTTPRLSETEADPICARAGERYGFDWCGYLRGLATTIRFKTGTQECDSSGYCSAELTHTLFVGKEQALLLAERQAFDHPPMPVVVEVTREQGQWYAWEHGDNYGCIPRDDGFESSICWRRFSAWPASYKLTEEKAQAVERSTAASPPSILDSLEVEGISLSTPLPEALTTLEAAGYTTETVTGPGSHRNVLTTRDYSRRLGNTARQLKLIAINNGIRALSFRVYGEENPETGFEPPAPGDADFLVYETDEWQDGGDILAVEASGFGKSFLRYQKWTTRYGTVEIDLLRRAEAEAIPEQAFYDRWLDEWLGQVKVPASSRGPCIDRYAHLRGPDGNGCQTPMERAVSYLEKVRAGANIRQLESGLSYEVLVNGQGSKPSPNSSIVAYLVFKYLDGARKDDRINHWQKIVREIQWPDVKEALLSMKEGDKWRIYVPPGVGSNDSRYLQLTEIELTRVGGS